MMMIGPYHNNYYHIIIETVTTMIGTSFGGRRHLPPQLIFEKTKFL